MSARALATPPGIAAELLIAAIIVYVPAVQSLLARLRPAPVSAAAPVLPVIVWGADELRRMVVGRRERGARLLSGARARKLRA